MLVSVLKNKSSNLTQGSKIGITIFVLENDINAKRDQVAEKKYRTLRNRFKAREQYLWTDVVFRPIRFVIPTFFGSCDFLRYCVTGLRHL